MTSFQSRYASAEDGLRLHFRDYGEATSAEVPVPVVCLPGLSRTAADFDRLARALARDGRRVLALDYRGRGLSERDPDPRNYDLKVESADVLAVLASAGVAQAIFVGTSRGGLITMILATVHRGLIRGAVLNDIGPVIERAGLERIRGYVGRLPQPQSWAEAREILKRVAGSQFTALGEAEWQDYAELTFREDDGVFGPVYDTALSQAVQAMDLDHIPTLWPQFEALRVAPLLIVRGENSDLLSVATLEDMTRRHPDCTVHTVPAQGHAPFLADAPTIAAIGSFVSRCSALVTGAPHAPAME